MIQVAKVRAGYKRPMLGIDWRDQRKLEVVTRGQVGEYEGFDGTLGWRKKISRVSRLQVT